MKFEPAKYATEHAQQIVAEAMNANKTFSTPLVRIEDSVKNDLYVSTVSGDVTIQAYKENATEADITNGIVFKDEILRPTKLMVIESFKPDANRFTRFAQDMIAGAANITSNRAEQETIAYAQLKLGRGIEKAFYTSITSATKAAIAAMGTTASATEQAWAAAQPDGKIDGVIARLIYNSMKLNAAGDVAPGFVDAIDVAGVVITATNIAAEYAKVFAAIPSSVLSEEDVTIFAPFSHLQLIKQANANATYRDIFTVTGNVVYYLGVKVEFVPLSENVIIAGRSSDIVLGTDLVSDFTEFEFGKVNNIGDEMFLKAVFTLEAAVIVPTQKVLYVG
jgi:hypothetical protein